jgi:hypothetical protein
MQAVIYQRLGKEAFDKLEDGATVELDFSSTQLLTYTKVAGDGRMGLNQIKELRKFFIGIWKRERFHG